MPNAPILFYEEGTCALGSLIALALLGQPYRLCRLQEDDPSSEFFLKLNPLGEVPTFFTDDGILLTESFCILHHIGKKGISMGLSFGQDSSDFDRLNRALAYLTSSFHKAFAPLFSAELFHPDKKIQKEIRQTVIQGNLKDQLTHVNGYWLAERNLLFSDRPTIADCYLYATARWAKNWFDLEKEFPNISRFLDRMEQNASVKTALEIEEGKIKKTKDAFHGHLDLESFNSVPDMDHSLLLPGLQTSMKSTTAEPDRRSGAV